MSESYKSEVLNAIINGIKDDNQILAAWVGGSAATDSLDEFSDIDLCLLADSPIQSVIEKVEKVLQKFQVTHTWQTAKSPWGEGIAQRVFYLKNAPKYFCVDLGVFDPAYPQLLKDFLEVERHGHPKILFDKKNKIQLGHTDPVALFAKQKMRLEELSRGFPVFKSLVLKEIERNLPIDAIGFYQNGMLRPLIEVMGMIHRPYKYDFGMRYIHKSFPLEEQIMIQDLSYISDMKDLSEKVNKVEQAFFSAAEKVRQKKSL